MLLTTIKKSKCCKPSTATFNSCRKVQAIRIATYSYCTQTFPTSTPCCPNSTSATSTPRMWHLLNLDSMVSKFNKCHIHAEDEVRYIVAGEGIFGFVRPDGSQVELTVQPEEFINVPANTEHWFYLTAARKIKAVRYFTTKEGWTPQYTDTEIRSRLAAV